MSRKLEERIEQVRALRAAASPVDVLPALRKALRDRANLVVAEAAKTIAVLHLAELIADLLNAFDRLLEDPVKTDSKCWGKNAIVKALTELDYDQSPPFVRGAGHIQMEPVWGGQEDSAATLRGLCVLGLVQCSDLRRFDVLRHVVDALSDNEAPVRVEAVRALGQLGGDDASLLLRLKARMGDASPSILGYVFDALLALEGERVLDFVGGYLNIGIAEKRDEAALALGSSRLPGSVELLIKTFKESADHEFGGVILRALSSSRDPNAIEFLLDLLRNGNRRDSALALDALKLHQGSPDIWSRVQSKAP